jgi:O-acetyl-ADP-ribose deacetylase (regulator of RNase III)
MTNIEIIKADITTLNVDAIVNAANRTLLGGGGVDGAIHRAAGPGLLKACKALPEVEPGVRCPTGEARITQGFRLPARYVIHTVGPVWKDGEHDEETLLSRCYAESLALARKYRIESVAFPAISCGVYGFPIDEAAEIAVETIRDVCDGQALPRRVILCAFSDQVADAWESALHEG